MTVPWLLSDKFQNYVLCAFDWMHHDEKEKVCTKLYSIVSTKYFFVCMNILSA